MRGMDSMWLSSVLQSEDDDVPELVVPRMLAV